ncbi:hypothetical protein ABE354_23090 [Brevibacillus laterosporus]|uniref:hypothetical protein n=1 Tax=Brevibacillus laterosporus TaxID=1465 RepID=UPI003D1DECDA
MFKKSIIAFALVVVSAFSVSVAFANETQLSNTTASDKYWASITKKYTALEAPDEISYDDGRGYIGTLNRGVGTDCFSDGCNWTYSGWMYYQY